MRPFLLLRWNLIIRPSNVHTHVYTALILSKQRSRRTHLALHQRLLHQSLLLLNVVLVELLLLEQDALVLDLELAQDRVVLSRFRSGAGIASSLLLLLLLLLLVAWGRLAAGERPVDVGGTRDQTPTGGEGGRGEEGEGGGDDGRGYSSGTGRTSSVGSAGERWGGHLSAARRGDHRGDLNLGGGHRGSPPLPSPSPP